jgi:hypothetical protein
MTYSDEYDYQGWYCPRCADKEEEEETKREAEEEEEDNQ